ncbi:MAG: ABC transporter substrate-binding protein [Actinomycetota bacterium]|nr:ABC transporter substrate-binding protein [Actinomycetota bacterium]
MRRFRVLTSLVLTMTLLAACGGNGDDEGGGEAQPRPNQPAREDLVVGTPADTFNVSGDRANLGMFPINANIFETLVRMTADFQVEPGLAERWEYRGDNTWRFFLRRGVQFHNGQSLNAEAVKLSLDRLVRTGGGSLRLGPESVKPVDEITVDITPTQPNFRLVDQLVHPSVAPIVAPNTDVGTQPTGTGPFRFVEYVKDQRLVVERNDAYWGDKAKLRRITFRFIPEDNSRWLSLRAGEVDLIYDLPRTLVDEADRTPGIKLGITPPGGAEVMYLNRSGNEPYTILADGSVRRAVAAAIDRRAVVTQVFPKAAESYNTVSPAALFGQHASLVRGVPYDPAQARTLLDQAGWRPGSDGIRVKDGKRLTLTMVNGYPPIDLRKPMPELLQAQLKDVGIEVRIAETPELATYTDRLKNGEGDLFLERISQNDATPSQAASSFFYSKATGDYAKWFSAGRQYDQAIEAALAAPDREEAKRLTATAIRNAVDEEVVVVPLAAVYWLFAMKDGVQGFLLHGSARHVRWAPVFWSAS